MSLRISAAALAAFLSIAAPAVLASTPASAADLYGEGDARGSAYDDPRYGDIYRHPAPPPVAAPYVPEPRRQAYRPEYEEPPFREHQDYQRDVPPPHRNAYSDFRRDGRGEGRGDGCVPQHIIRQTLERRGWADFQDVDVRGDVAHIRARRLNGQWFDITVDRCNGQILETRVLDRRAAQADDWRYRERAPGY